jgi:hypothetical protein
MQIGEKYGRLTVAEFLYKDSHPRRYFRCVCECGGEVVTHTNSLRTGNTKSCGCLAKEARLATRLPNDRGVINHIVLQYKRHARTRGISFELTYEEVERLVRSPCAYCGIVGGNFKKTKNRREGFAHNGIDRVDSSLNYVTGNVVPCCGLCNRAKRDMPRDVFLEWALRVAAHHQAMAQQWGGYTDLVTLAEAA